MPTPPDTPASTVRGWQQDGRNIAEPVGISWYTSETWKWFAAISEANIQKSDRQFVRATEKHEREFAARGIRTIRLAIDIDQMIAWCHRDGYEIDGTGRSETIDRVLRNRRLLGAALGDAGSWSTWLAVLRASFGLPLDQEQARLFASVAGNRAPPSKRVRELWCLVGRKAGKSRMAAAIAVYCALFLRHKLSRGERGMVLVLAMSMDQAKVSLDYCIGFLAASDVLRREIVSTTANEIRLRNGITIATHANSFRSVRGRSLCAAIFDEVCFWPSDNSALPDTETYTAILPSLLPTNGVLVGISSAYRRAGLMFAKHEDYFGVDAADTLVVKGSTQAFNGTVDAARLAAMRVADPTAAASEWDSEFRDDLSGLFDAAVIDRVVNGERPLELPPREGLAYQGFVDPSGGAVSGDLCAVHWPPRRRAPRHRRRARPRRAVRPAVGDGGVCRAVPRISPGDGDRRPLREGVDAVGLAQGAWQLS